MALCGRGTGARRSGRGRGAGALWSGRRCSGAGTGQTGRDENGRWRTPVFVHAACIKPWLRPPGDVDVSALPRRGGERGCTERRA
jgi:hypothetical protein